MVAPGPLSARVLPASPESTAHDPVALWASAQVTALEVADAPEYGSPAWCALRATDHRRAVAIITAAEQWRRRASREATLAAAYATARDALAAFITASDAFDDSVTEAATLLKAAGAPQCAGTAEDMAGPPASPDAPRWFAGIGGAAVDLSAGDVRNTDGAAARLAVLLDDLDRATGVRSAIGAPEFTRVPISEQARRGRGALHPQLDQHTSSRQ